MNFQQAQLKVCQDAELAQKAAEFFKIIQSRIALKSFEGARAILFSPYSMTLLGQDKVSYLKSEIDKAEANFRKDGNRIYWEWYVIFVFSTLFAAYYTWKFGIVQVITKLISGISKIAKLILGNAIYAISTTIGLTFSYLCKILKDLSKKIFS